MTNRIQSLRSSLAGARPAGQIPGTIYTNFADRQIGVVNASQAATDLVGVRFFSSAAVYALGDYVINAGQLYRAPGTIPAGAFNAGQWVAIGNAMFDQSLNTTDAVRFRSMQLGRTGTPGELDFMRDLDGALGSRIFELSHAAGEALGLECAGGPILFYSGVSAPGANPERMRIDTAGNVICAGALTVNSNAHFLGTATMDGQIIAVGPLTLGKAGRLGEIHFNRPADGAFAAQIFDSDTQMGIESAGGVPLVFYCGTSGPGANPERMRIDTAGNVICAGGFTVNGNTHLLGSATIDLGLYTAGPLQLGKTGVSGQLNLLRDSDAAFVGRVFELAGGAGLGIEQGGGQPILFYTAAGAPTGANERMRIDASGNVGIGMVPSGILDVARNQNSTTYARLLNSDTGANANSQFQVGTGSNSLTVCYLGAGFSAPGIPLFKADGASLHTSAPNGLAINSRINAPIYFGTNDIERMRIDANGNVGIGTAAPANYALGAGLQVVMADTANANLTLASPGYCTFSMANPAAPNSQRGFIQYSIYDDWMRFATTNGTERMRIDANGYLKASNFGTYLFPSSLKHEFVSNKDGEECLAVTNSFGNNPYGLAVFFSGGAPNNATNYFFRSQDTGGTRAYIMANGGLWNYSANNANLSDESVKDYITPYTPKELDDLEKSFGDVIWGKFKYRDQTHDDWNHGPTAQGVERAFSATAPELIDEGDFGPKGEADKPVEKRKVIYETDLTNIAHALLARALTRINELEKTVAFLLGGKPASV